jgi:diguanylate cyclase (GGDEF)-like protein
VLLQKFAEILKTFTRASDFCGRLGGDEFLLVITHVEVDAMHKTVERFREKLADHQFEIGNQNVSVTASFGIAGFSGNEILDFSTLIRRADKALYAAKRAGRNLIRAEPELVE